MIEASFSLDLVDIPREDIEQEGALVTLAGKTPRLSLIKKRLESKTLRVFDFTDELPAYAEPVPWSDYNADPEVIFEIAKWAIHQSEIIREKILEFLDEPSQETVDELIHYLVEEKIIQQQEARETNKNYSLGELILTQLKLNKTMTLDEIYQFEEIFYSQRPRAAIRQALRRLISKKLIRLIGKDTYEAI